jgi:ribosome-associated protein
MKSSLLAGVVDPTAISMESRVLAQYCREFAENRKAENVVILDVRELSGVTDYFVIATGSSEPHLRAIHDEITDRLREDYGEKPSGTEGSVHSSWVVLDYIDVMVHVMREEVRTHFDLEGLWGDAPKIRRSSAKTVSTPASRTRKSAPAKE